MGEAEAMRNLYKKKVGAVGLKERARERERIYNLMLYPALFREVISGNVVWNGNSVSNELEYLNQYLSVYHGLALQMKLMMAEGVFGDIAKYAYITSGLWWEARDSLHPGYCSPDGLGIPFGRTGRKWEKVSPLPQALPAGLSRWEVIDGDTALPIRPVCESARAAAIAAYRYVHKMGTRKIPKYEHDYMEVIIGKYLVHPVGV